MRKTEEQNTIILRFNTENTLSDCIKKIANDKELHQKNVIVDITHLSFSLEEIDEFIPFSVQFKEKNNCSFVLIINQFTYEELPEELTTAPTLQEAFDIIELEEIERDLGF